MKSIWGEWRDLNPRSPGPQPGALDHWATLTTGIDIIAERAGLFNEKVLLRVKPHDCNAVSPLTINT